MKIRFRRPFARTGALLCAALFAAVTVSARAPRYTPPGSAPDPDPLPAEAPPLINPDAAPSLTLEPFLGAHLDKLLAPLGTAAFAQADLIADVRAAYVRALETASEERKPACRLALAVCDAMSHAIVERQKAATALNQAYQMRHPDSMQARGSRPAVKESAEDEAFFYNSQKDTWLQDAAILRRQIVVIYQRERETEIRAGGPWVASIAPTNAAAAPTPFVAVPPPAVVERRPPEADPIVGNWKWDGSPDVAVNADHTLSGPRGGTWVFVASIDGKRHYEFRHDEYFDWADQLTLSADGRTLEGTDKDGRHISARRE